MGGGTHHSKSLVGSGEFSFAPKRGNQLKGTFFFSLFSPINFNGSRTSVTQNVMGQEDGWVHLKPLVTGQKTSWWGDRGSMEFNNMAWAIFINSKWKYVAKWFGISTQQNQSSDSINHISTGQTFKVTFSKYAPMTLLIPENDLIQQQSG